MKTSKQPQLKANKTVYDTRDGVRLLMNRGFRPNQANT